MNIEMLNCDERESSIRSILDTAMPVKRTLFGEIKRLINVVGLKYAFCGVGNAVAAALLVSFGIIFAVSILTVAAGDDFTDSNYFFIPVLFFAPILYFSMLVFTSWKEQMTKTWEVLASCRYNLKYVTAIRVMIVSAAGMIFIPLSTLPLAVRAEYPNIIAAAFGSMFLYSALTLLLLLISESLILKHIAPMIWIVGWGLLLVTFTPLQVERFIANIPLAISILLACVLLALYLLELRVFIMRTTRRTALA